MVFDDEMDFETNENATSKNTEPQLEKYGVWIKKGPETLESPQEIPEINDIPDVTETTDFSDISVIEEDIISSENEQIESIDDELSSLIDTTPTVEESSSFADAPIDTPVIEDTPTIPEETQIPVDTGLPEGFDIPGIDLSAFENVDIPIDDVSEVYLFQWNRDYPADVYFDYNLKELGFKKVGSEEFEGSSHKKITLEIYRRV